MTVIDVGAITSDPDFADKTTTQKSPTCPTWPLGPVTEEFQFQMRAPVTNPQSLAKLGYDFFPQQVLPMPKVPFTLPSSLPENFLDDLEGLSFEGHEYYLYIYRQTSEILQVQLQSTHCEKANIIIKRLIIFLLPEGFALSW